MPFSDYFKGGSNPKYQWETTTEVSAPPAEPKRRRFSYLWRKKDMSYESFVDNLKAKLDREGEYQDFVDEKCSEARVQKYRSVREEVWTAVMEGKIISYPEATGLASMQALLFMMDGGPDIEILHQVLIGEKELDVIADRFADAVATDVSEQWAQDLEQDLWAQFDGWQQDQEEEGSDECRF